MSTRPMTLFVPTYNRATLTVETVRSCLAQTASPNCFQVVVVDNASTDGTIERLAEFANAPNFRVVCNPSNIGMVGNWNRCLDLAEDEFRSDFCMIIHSDDIVLPTLVDEVLHYVASHSFDVAFAGAAIVDESLRVVRASISPAQTPPGGSILSADDFAWLIFLSQGSPVTCPSAVFDVLRLGGSRFRSKYQMACDVDFWFNLASEQHRTFAYLPGTSVYYRMHRLQESNMLPAQQNAVRRETLECHQEWYRRVFKARYTSQQRRTVQRGILRIGVVWLTAGGRRLSLTDLAWLGGKSIELYPLASLPADLRLVPRWVHRIVAGTAW